MEIVVAGSSGLIGTALVEALKAKGHRVVRLVRRPARGADEAQWDPPAGQLDPTIVDGTDAVINLAGAGIGDKRWTDAYRRLLVESRVDTTSLLARTAADSDRKPSVFIGGSAIGYYGNRGDEILTEQSKPGEGFLADLCQAWEAAAKPAADAGIRTVAIRTGIVLATEGGVLPKLLPLFKLGVGGRFGPGQQYLSWISIDDEIAAILHLLETTSISGPVNLTAPDPTSNAEFTDILADVLHRPSMLPVPKFGPRLLLGADRADALLFDGQRVMPEVLSSSAFEFTHPTLEAALRDILDKR